MSDPRVCWSLELHSLTSPSLHVVVVRLPIKAACVFCVARRISKYFPFMLHFKLKHGEKKVHRSIYNDQHRLVSLYKHLPSCSYTITQHSNASEKKTNRGLEVRTHETFVADGGKKKKKKKKLSVKSTKQHIQGVGLLSEHRVIVETGVTVEGVGAPVPVFWSPNQPPPVTPAHKVFQTTLV